MSKLKISAKQVLNDINAGMSDADLMEKYGVSPKGLETLFRKLADAGLLKEASLNQRSVGKKQQPPKPSEYAATPTGPTIEPQQKPDDTFTRIAEDVRNGLHDGEIMRRYELSPGMLREMKEKLVQKGYLDAGHVAHAETKRTKICPSCSHEIPQSAGKCTHCGAWLNGEPSETNSLHPTAISEPSEVVSSEHAREEDEKECAWEERANYGTIKAYFMTATECLVRPTRFFSTLPKEGGYWNPILFGVMSGVMGLVLGYLWSSLFSGGLIGLIGLLFLMSIVFVLSLIFLPVVLFIWSALLHGSLWLLKGANEGFQTTFRVASYACVTTLFNALPIPYVGNIASLWGLVLTVIGLRETHKTSLGKAVAAVLISVAVVVAILAIFFAGTLSAALSGTKASKASNVPQEVCTALRTFVDKVDSAADSDNEEELQAASKEFEEVLAQFQDHKGVAQLRGKAFAYQMAVVIQRQLAKAGGARSGTAQFQSGLQRQRDELLACSGVR